MAIVPKGHRVLIKPDSVDDQLNFDFGNGKTFQIVADKRLERSGQVHGTLVAVGEQAWKAFGKDFTGEPWASVGDKVLFCRNAGQFVCLPGEENDPDKQFLLCNDEDITAVITDE